jgi:hypothetical protein
MKIFFTLLFSGLCFMAKAQTKEFIVVDLTSQKALSTVSVFFPNKNEGAVTNDDGKVKIYYAKNSADTLVFSHVAYQTKKMIASEYLSIDTIKLIPSTILLNEVFIYSLDLEKKLADILINYEKLYATQASIHDCTYKESYEVNDTLARLAQLQIKWWDKNYRFNFKESFDKQNQISLTNIDYSKVLDSKSYFSNSGFIENKFIFQLLHLNFYPIILNRGSDISLQSVDKYEKNTRVVFTTPIIEKGEVVMFLNDGIIYFDNETGAIEEIDLNFKYNNQIKKGVSRKTKTPYTSEVKEHHINLSFKKIDNQKWMISSLKSVVEADVEYNNTRDNVQLTQEFIITKTTKGGRIPKSEQINLNNPLYENLPLKKNLDTKILLTQKEQAFINKKD